MSPLLLLLLPVASSDVLGSPSTGLAESTHQSSQHVNKGKVGEAKKLINAGLSITVSVSCVEGLLEQKVDQEQEQKQDLRKEQKPESGIVPETGTVVPASGD